MQAEVQIPEFLSRVVPWPGSVTDPGWVNLHWRSAMQNDPAKSFWGGRPVKSVNDFMWWVGWCAQRPGIKDIFFCTSLQSQIGKNSRGGPKVMRGKELALSLKALWLDVDVKDPPKGYATLEEAIGAVAEFVKAAGLPPPSALIATGGGLHCYWISKTPLTPFEWQPYAEGLKALALTHNLRCDAGVTTDCARILRVPGTFNHKQEPLRPVRVLGLAPAEKDYDFKNTFAALAALSPPTRVSSPLFIEGPQEKAAAFVTLPQESLAEGIGHDETPLVIDNIVRGCAFIKDALKTGGAEYSQPMWNLTTLAATFMEDGHALAHKMGEKHPTYTSESTEALWERKNKERKDRGLGWPSCKAIQASGCGACVTCPHFAAGKSPLNLGERTAEAKATLALPFAAVTTLADVDDEPIDLPFGYVLNDDNLVCKVEEQKGKKGEPSTTIVTPIFHTTITKPWVQDNPKAFNFITSTDKGNSKPVSIKLELMVHGTEMWKLLQGQGVIPDPKYTSECLRFLMSFLSKLQKAKSAAQSLPFGWWTGPDGNPHGFVYGGTVMKDDNTESPAGFGAVKTREIYKPTGTVQPWLDACKMVTDQKRPELDAIIAASFAAPLFTVTGEYSGFLSAWGTSGPGKSTATKVGLAVWGHPKLAKEVALSTARSIIAKMGDLKNLPVYWDEIKDERAQKSVFDVLFSGTEGVGPGRLTSQIEQRDRTDWQTMITICSNLSFIDYVVKNQPTTDAGIYRVFEYKVGDHVEGAPGRISTMEASRITQKLETNYGVMGLMYAKTLGSDPAAIDKFTKEFVEAFAKEVNQTGPERYWPAICGTLLAGATLANMLGATIDVMALHDFLVVKYMENRERRISEATAGGGLMNTEEALTGFLREHSGRTLYTDTFPTGRGRPPAISIIWAPKLDAGKGITVQWSVQSRMLRVSRLKFVEYLTFRQVAPSAIFRGLKEHFGMKVNYASLGGNTPYKEGQEHLICIPIPEGSSLEGQMLVHTSSVANVPGGETGLQETSPQTPQALTAL